MRCTWPIRAGCSTATRTGSPPPMSRWPVSRQSAMRLPASTRSVSSPVSTMVPTWGCRVASRPCSAAASEIRSRLASRVAHCASSSTGPLVVALRAGGGGDDDRRRLRGGERLHGQHDLRQGVGRGVVQHHGHELADGAQPGGGERARLGLGGVREEPVGAELGGREADLAHLLQHQVRAELVAPARHLAHAPGDRRAGDPVAQGGRRGRVAHRLSFVRWSVRQSSVGRMFVGVQAVGISDSSTRRPSCSESVQASATRKASRASRTVHGLSTSPRATPRKWVSSAR